jgi:hypothetical protein
MTEVIVHTHNEDNSRVVVTYPSGEISINELIERVVDKSKPYTIINEDDLPNDTNYFEAWQLIDGKIVINMDKARDRHRDILRDERQKYFASLDILFMRAIEAMNIELQQDLASQKQKLRDITSHPAIMLATTTIELHALNIDSLLNQ